MVIGAILVGLLIFGVMQKLDEGSREDAAAALFAAQRLLPSTSPSISSGLNITLGIPDADEAASRAEALAALDQVIADFGGTPQAVLAQIEAGSTLHRTGKYEEALAYFEAASGAEGTMGMRATSSKGAALESLGRSDEAAAAYESVRETASGGLRAQATIDLTRVLVAKGDVARAKELYSEFESEFPDSVLLAEVQAKAAALP
jgi:tetratricopeptide (TPR) repeat protein